MYDSKTRQHKNYTVTEAKIARSQLYTAIAQGQHIGSPASVERNQADKRTLSDLLEVLPSGGVINFLRTNNFAGFPFEIDALSPLRRFLYERNGPEHEFLDSELEGMRKTLQAACQRFATDIAVNTFPTHSVTFSSVPSEWEDCQPERFEKVVDLLHSGAQAVCDSYDRLIKTGRHKLHV